MCMYVYIYIHIHASHMFYSVLHLPSIIQQRNRPAFGGKESKARRPQGGWIEGPWNAVTFREARGWSLEKYETWKSLEL